jgi:flagellar L-ring protein precursor FlgH
VEGRVIKDDVTKRSGPGRSEVGAVNRRLGYGFLLAVMVFVTAAVARGAVAASPQTEDPVKKDSGKKSDPATSALDAYLARVHARDLAAPASVGSTWSDTGRLSRMMSDVRAFQPHDLIDVLVTESIVSTANGSIQGSRTSAASSQISALMSLFSKSSSAANLLNQTSSNTLTGTAQAADNSTLTTTLGGTVVEVLPNGVMVIEAARQIHFSQETQTIILRGLVRPEDVSAQNQVISTAISDMEVQVVGKGIVEDYTHRPNFFVRAIESLLIF